MARRRHNRVRARVPYAGPQPGSALALLAPADTDLTGALCTVVHPEVFFPDTAEGPAAEQLAKSVCTACPVREACLALAVRNGERFGVFGGLTVAERDALSGRPGGCGTYSGYKRHLREGDPACLACRAASRATTAAARAKARTAGRERSDREAAA